MKTLNRKLTMMSVVFASLITFTASANSSQPSIESALTDLVIKQGEQVITHLKNELAETIQEELNSFSIDVFDFDETQENTTTVNNENLNNKTITSEE